MAKTISSDYAERMKDPSLTWYEKLYGKTEASAFNDLIHRMHEYGVSRLEATYHGGHDEGGVEEFYAFDEQDAPLEIENMNWEHPLQASCNEVLSTKFLSWALGCTVVGTLHANLKEKRIWTQGEIESFVPDEEPIEWTW
jgi:hypothetical protein